MASESGANAWTWGVLVNWDTEIKKIPGFGAKFKIHPKIDILLQNHYSSSQLAFHTVPVNILLIIGYSLLAVAVYLDVSDDRMFSSS